MKKIYLLFLITLLLIFSFDKLDALEKINEVRLNVSGATLSEGVLPNDFTITTTTSHITIVDDNCFWMYWCKRCTAWLGFGKETPTAVDDGITHYGIRVAMHTDPEYELADDVRIIVNGNDITNFGHTKKNNVGTGVFIDFGTVGDELPRYTVNYNLGGGSSDKIEDEVVIAGDNITLPAYRNVTNPSGQIIKNWRIDGVDYVQHDHYTPTKNTTVYAVYETDNYIRESRATLTQSIDQTITPNDLVFTSTEPSKYTVSLYRVYDLTDKTQNTSSTYNDYPHDKNFISNHEYAIEFSFQAINGYQYDQVQNDRSSSFYLNDELTDMAGYTSLSGCTDRRVVIKANQNNEIPNVKISILAPTVDGSLYEKPVIVFPSKARVYAYDWFENGEMLSKNFDKFEEGHTYELRVNVAASVIGAFTNTIATINGEQAELHKTFPDDYMNITFKRSFTVPTIPRINEISSTSSVPEIGVSLNEPPVISTDKVNLYAYDWYEDGNRMSKYLDKFSKGHTYKLKVRATTTDKFSDDIVVKVNGKQTTIEEITSDKRQLVYSVEYTLSEDYLVTYDSLGGSIVSDKNYEKDSLLGELPIPTKDGYDFDGWYTDPEFKNRVTDTTLVNASFTLYAKWVEKPKEQNNNSNQGQENNQVIDTNVSVAITKGESNSLNINISNYYPSVDYTLEKCTKNCGKKNAKFEIFGFFADSTFNYSGLKYGTKYYFRVFAFIDGERYYSNVVSGTPVPNQVKNLHIIEAKSKNIKIGYDKVNVTGYEIQRSTKATSGFKKVTLQTKNSKTTYNNKKLKNATTYYYRVRAYKTIKGKKIYGAWSDVVSATTGPAVPKKPIIKAINYETIRLNLKGSKTATYYEISRSTKKNKGFSLLGATTELYYEDTVNTGTTYYYKVRACNAAGVCSGWTSQVNKKTSLSKTTINSNKEITTSLDENGKEIKTGKVTLTLSSVDGAYGYEIQRSNKKSSGFKKVTDITDLSYEDNNVKVGKTYYYRARAYRLIGTKKVNSGFTKIIKVTVK